MIVGQDMTDVQTRLKLKLTEEHKGEVGTFVIVDVPEFDIQIRQFLFQRNKIFSEKISLSVSIRIININCGFILLHSHVDIAFP